MTRIFFDTAVIKATPSPFRDLNNAHTNKTCSGGAAGAGFESVSSFLNSPSAGYRKNLRVVGG